MSLNMLWR